MLVVHFLLFLSCLFHVRLLVVFFNIFYLIFVLQEPFWNGFVHRRDVFGMVKFSNKVIKKRAECN